MGKNRSPVRRERKSCTWQQVRCICQRGEEVVESKVTRQTDPRHCRTGRGIGDSCQGAHRASLAIAEVLPGMNREKLRLIEYNPSLKVLSLLLALAFSPARVP